MSYRLFALYSAIYVWRLLSVVLSIVVANWLFLLISFECEWLLTSIYHNHWTVGCVLCTHDKSYEMMKMNRIIIDNSIAVARCEREERENNAKSHKTFKKHLWLIKLHFNRHRTKMSILSTFRRYIFPAFYIFFLFLR